MSVQLIEGVTYQYHIFSGGTSVDGEIVLPANANEQLIRQAVEEVSGQRLGGLVLDRYSTNLTFRSEAVFG